MNRLGASYGFAGYSRSEPKTLYETGQEGTDTVYSDRLLTRDFDKYNRTCLEVFGNKRQLWNNRNPLKIQDFLRKYLDNENLVLTKVMQYTDSSGYPCWRFDYK